jgi:hypothetical protein
MNVLLPYKWSQDHVALVSGPGPSMIRNSNGCFSCEEEKSWTHKLRLKGFNMGHFGWYFCVNFGMVCPHAPPQLATYSIVEDFQWVKNKPHYYLFVGLHVVALLNRTLVFEWYMPRLVLRACLHESNWAMPLENPWTLIGWECHGPCFRFTWGQSWTTTPWRFHRMKNLHGIPHGRYG